jgi:phage antirepressor YoqD-like protein
MSNLVLTKIENNEGLEFHVDEATNMVYASISAAARMFNADHRRVSETCRDWPTETAEIVTSTGVKTCRVLSPQQVFKMSLKYNVELAEKMGTAGANVFMLGIAGYQLSVKPAFDIPDNLGDALILAGNTQLKLDAANAKIEADKEKVEFADAVDTAISSVSIEQFAKLTEGQFGLGRNNMFKRLRGLHIIQPAPVTLPYQKYVSAGYFEVGEVVKNERCYVYSRITGKGQLWATKKLLEQTGAILENLESCLSKQKLQG